MSCSPSQNKKLAFVDRKCLAFLTLCLALALTKPLFAEDGWLPVYDKHGITAYKKKNSQGGFLSSRGEAVIDAPLNIVALFGRDEKKALRILPRTTEKRVLEKLSPTERIDYDHIELVWPLSDRYLIYRVKEAFTSDKEILFTINSVKDFPFKDENKVLGAIKNGKIRMTSLEKEPSKTYVSVEIHLDPGGWVPGFLVERYIPDWSKDFLKSLKKNVRMYLENPKEYDASLVLILPHF